VAAAAGITALHQWYRLRTGLWAGTGWWNCASALTAVIRYTQLTGDDSHAGVIATTFTAAQRQHARFVNTYYDDNAWWALAWIAAFDLTRALFEITGDRGHLRHSRIHVSAIDECLHLLPPVGTEGPQPHS
jgi:Glycosyl hydrolase family 76